MKYIMIFVLALTFTQCRTYYKIFGEKSDYFTKEEKVILEKTTGSIDFDYGYDPVTELHYVFPTNQGYSGSKISAGKLTQSLRDFDNKSLEIFNEKIYRLHKLTVYRMEHYKEIKSWKNYTYIRKYLLPPLENYTEVLERSVLSRDPVYAEKFNKRKKRIDREIKREINKKEFEEIWENDYNS